MKRLYLIILILLFHWFSVAGQEKMIVHEEDWIAYTYQDVSQTVSSLNRLPKSVQKNVKILMEESFWGFKDSIHFVNAQIVDMVSYLKDGDAHEKNWVVPRYELNFYLKDVSIGIIRYNITLHLDDYGQILKLNWPRQGFGSKNMFLPRETIQEFALKEATKRGYNVHDFVVDFGYDEPFDTLCWELSFLEREMVGGAEYNFIKIPCNELRIIDSTKTNR